MVATVAGVAFAVFMAVWNGGLQVLARRRRTVRNVLFELFVAQAVGVAAAAWAVLPLLDRVRWSDIAVLTGFGAVMVACGGCGLARASEEDDQMNSSADLDDYERKLLSGWEEIYKRGLLTMWLLLAVRDRPRYPAEIAEFINTTTQGTMAADQRSLYRAMRRLSDIELVETSDQPGRRTGADRRYYRITRSGQRVLDAFLDRHVRGIYLAGPAAGLFA